MKKTLNCQIEEEIDKKIKDFVEKTGMTKRKLVEKAIIKYITEFEKKFE